MSEPPGPADCSRGGVRRAPRQRRRAYQWCYGECRGWSRCSSCCHVCVGSDGSLHSVLPARGPGSRGGRGGKGGGKGSRKKGQGVQADKAASGAAMAFLTGSSPPTVASADITTHLTAVTVHFESSEAWEERDQKKNPPSI